LRSKIAKGGADYPSPPQAFSLILFNVQDHAALVLSAVAASMMGQAELAAVGALDDAGGGELPVGRAPLITPLSGDFSFRDCHVDTS
jgi:hypothetical protein